MLLTKLKLEVLERGAVTMLGLPLPQMELHQRSYAQTHRIVSAETGKVILVTELWATYQERCMTTIRLGMGGRKQPMVGAVLHNIPVAIKSTAFSNELTR